MVLSEGQAGRTLQEVISKQVPEGVGNPSWSWLRKNFLAKDIPRVYLG